MMATKRAEGEACPRCDSLAHSDIGVVSTAMAVQNFTDREGRQHRHDPNYHTEEFLCSDCGHEWGISKRFQCVCGWPNKEEA